MYWISKEEIQYFMNKKFHEINFLHASFVDFKDMIMGNLITTSAFPL